MKLPRVLHLLLFAIFCSVGLHAYSNIVFDQALFDAVAKRYDKQAEQRVRSWQSLIIDNQKKSVPDQLYAVNRFFNKLEFKSDLDHWGKSDYWATPIEFLGTNAGDCEDFSIAKYVTLLQLGIPDDKLRLMYATVTRPRQAHMVLAYYETPSSVPLVLGNINKRILPASQRRDLIPVYSFNGTGLWLAKAQGRGKKMQSGNNNKLWADLNDRMKNGF